MQKVRPWVAPLFLVLLLLAGSAMSEPILTGSQDAGTYLGFMNGFLEHGLSYSLYREPLYPLFLAGLKILGLDPVRSAPYFQNALFVGTLFFLVHTLLKNLFSKRSLWLMACGITLVPTFWFTMNGALYTESLSASLVFLYVGSVTRLYLALTQPQRNSRKQLIAWTGLAALVSILLDLNKGSFIYIQLAFPFVVSALVFLFRIRSKSKLNFALILLFLAIAGRFGVGFWFGSRPGGEPFFSRKIYERGGALFYGRVEYAKRFNFLKETPPYLLNSFSETLCRKVMGDRCWLYSWDAEGALGWELMAKEKLTDEELFTRGLNNALNSPMRQIVFMVYEWSRFVFHHSTTGFAALRQKHLDFVFRSMPVNFLLKIFNALLYLALPIMFLRSRKHWGKLREKLKDWPIEAKAGSLFCLAYLLSLLLTHGFVPTLVRMVFPVAPLLVLLNLIGFIFLTNQKALRR